MSNCYTCGLPPDECLCGGSVPRRLDWSRLLNEKPKPPDWLIWPLVERGQSVSLYSAPKVGKSLVILDMLARLCDGRPALGYQPRRPLRAVYLDMENTEDDLRQRLWDMQASPEVLRNLAYYSFPPIPALDTISGGSALLDLVDQVNPDLVVIDTISRFIEGGENDSDTWLALYRNTMVHLKRRRVASLRLDHEGKDSDRGARGSSAKDGDVDTSWRLTFDDRKHIRTLDRKLTRTGHGPERVVLDVLTGPFRHELSDPGKDPVAVAIEALDDLDVPVEWGRDRAQEELRVADYKIRAEIISKAIKARRNRDETCSQGTEIQDPREQVLGTGDSVPTPGNSFSVSPGETCSEDLGTGREQPSRTDLFPASLPIRDAVGTGGGASGGETGDNDALPMFASDESAEDDGLTVAQIAARELERLKRGESA